MLFARDVMVDACFVQLAGAATVASAFGDLIYEILISRPELAVAITAFAISLISRSVIDTRTVHQGGLQVLCRYLQEVYRRCLDIHHRGKVNSSAVLLQ